MENIPFIIKFFIFNFYRKAFSVTPKGARNSISIECITHLLLCKSLLDNRKSRELPTST